ncbi:xaa-pro aminopeptidase [Fusarium langsethiae]|uniref:Probable Xaa-Pro aminopeptidase P n=1 Tax=Fusarium langsethiae TaxID=179993 RepID=A0A0N0DB42_FUSLA|nr:xaa-pro aminopeptidase [Fusarium langsethiae]GKU10729.1 unnamed protein product [Fusarium langsethiae]
MSRPAPGRLERLRGSMESQGIDFIVCFKPEHSFYLCGFNPIIYSHPVIGILARGNSPPILLVNTLRKDGAEATPGDRIVENYGKWFDVMTTGDTWQEAISKIITRHGNISGIKIGVELELSASNYDDLEQALPGATLIYFSETIQKCREIKDKDELDNARIAAKICNAQMVAAIGALRKPGCTEQSAVRAAWLAGFDLWASDYSHLSPAGFGSLEGGDLYSFKTWVLAGERRFLQCAAPIPRKIENEGVSVLIWSSVGGIHAELERTVFVGQVSQAEKRANNVVKSVRAQIFARLKPGIPINTLYELACGLLREWDYKAPGRIGHGIGLGAHETLSIDAKTTRRLSVGMILTIEPNVKVPVDGVKTQLSDTVVITKDGFNYLNLFPEDS